MKLTFSFLLAFCLIGNVVFSSTKLKSMKTGTWHAELALNDRLNLPFTIEVSKEGSRIKLRVINGEEELLLKTREQKDSVLAEFPELDAQFIFKLENEGKALRGRWSRHPKKGKIAIPLTAYWVESNEKMEAERFPDLARQAQKDVFSGTWRVTFSPDSKQSSEAIGIFKCVGTRIYGTFLTETGDYRFLEGNFSENEMRVSTYNGAWAMLFTATHTTDEKGNRLNGVFYSGASYSEKWTAIREENAALPDAFSAIKVVNPLDRFNSLNWLKLDGKSKIDINDEIKKQSLTLIQIMGTWCPNCVDETAYFKELHTEFQKNGLQIIAVCYEAGTDIKVSINKIKQFKKRMMIPYIAVYAGTANKELTAKDFPMLDEIKSYPTAILVNQKGEIVGLHSGYSGPATGTHYLTYKSQMRQLIEKELNIKK